LRAVSARGARLLAERVRAAVEQLGTAYNGTIIAATISVGVAHTMNAKSVENPAAFVAVADAALYEAKHQGRNRVVLAGRAA